MPDPFPPPFSGADQSAESLRRAAARVFDLAPQGSVIQDPARREKLGDAGGKVVTVTIELAAIAQAVPGLLGRLLASYLAGFEKDPGTGKLQPTKSASLNFLPSPLGYLDPTSVGLERNFYLPSGATNVLPRELDQFGLGLPEQRAIDEPARNAAVSAALKSRLLAAQKVLLGESNETLLSLVNTPAAFSRGAVILATSPAGADEVRVVAARELLARQQGFRAPLPELVGGLADALAAERAQRLVALGQVLQQGAALDAQQAAIAADLRAQGVVLAGPFGAAVSAGSIRPEGIEPVNDKARRNQAGATGIRKQLVSERADP